MFPSLVIRISVATAVAAVAAGGAERNRPSLVTPAGILLPLRP